MSTNKSIAASATLIAGATFLSRVLGFVRDVIIARFFGVTAAAQAFVVAFKIPNLFRDLVAEGAAGAAFVPVLSEFKARHSDAEFWELVSTVLALLMTVLALLVFGGILLSPLIVRFIAPGFAGDTHTFQLTVDLSRILFPYLFLVSLASFGASILHVFGHFTAPAFAPVFLNMAIIVCALTFGENTLGLTSGVLAGGILQLAVHLPPLYRRGFRLTAVKRLAHPEAVRIGRLLIPRVFSSAVYQLNNFVDSMFGSLSMIVGQGGVAALYYSYRLVQFPIGIFTNSLSQAILPAFSAQAIEETREHLGRTLSFGLRATFLVMLPASAGFMIMSRALVATLFQGGRFDAYATDATSGALFYYSIGLAAFGGSKVVQSCFFALKDTATPAKVASLGLVLNIALNALLMFPMRLAGLALATSLSGMVTFCVLFFLLKKRLAGCCRVRVLAVSFLRMALAAAAMAAVTGATLSRMSAAAATPVAKALSLGIPLTAGVFSYGLFCLLFGVGEMKELWGWMQGRWLQKRG